MRASRACSTIRSCPKPAGGTEFDAGHETARAAAHSTGATSASTGTGVTAAARPARRRRPPRRPGRARRQRMHRVGDLLDVIRRGAAAAADQPDAGADEAPGVRRHVVRRAQIEVAAVDVARLAGVGHRRQQGRAARALASRSIVSSIAAGPTLQFTPSTSAPNSSSCGPNCSAGVPSSVLPSSAVVSMATIGVATLRGWRGSRRRSR